MTLILWQSLGVFRVNIFDKVQKIEFYLSNSLFFFFFYVFVFLRYLRFTNDTFLLSSPNCCELSSKMPKTTAASGRGARLVMIHVVHMIIVPKAIFKVLSRKIPKSSPRSTTMVVVLALVLRVVQLPIRVMVSVGLIILPPRSKGPKAPSSFFFCSPFTKDTLNELPKNSYVCRRNYLAIPAKLCQLQVPFQNSLCLELFQGILL